MTLIFKAPHDEVERAKWREQANNAAAQMKKVTDWGRQIVFTPAFVFDDAVVKLPINVALIQLMSEEALAGWIFKTVLDIHAAPQVSAQPSDLGNASQPGAASAVIPGPAGAAVSERCAVKDGEEQCPNQAAGGLRVNLHATPAIQKRYGRRVMLSLIFDLPVCLACFPKITPANVMNDDQWRSFSKVAQQRNSGILADRGQTEIVLCKFEEPDYVALRQQIERQRAANESQSGPSGPTT